MLNKITTVGDSSIICDFGENVDLDTNSQVIKLFYYIKNLAEEKKNKRSIKLHALLQQTVD